MYFYFYFYLSEGQRICGSRGTVLLSICEELWSSGVFKAIHTIAREAGSAKASMASCLNESDVVHLGWALVSSGGMCMNLGFLVVIIQKCHIATIL